MSEVTFRKMGVMALCVVAVFDAILFHDTFLLREGELDVFTRWHGFPLPVVALVALVLAAHAWPLRFAWDRWLGPRRFRDGFVRIAVLITVGLAICHAMFWVPQNWWRAQVGLPALRY